MLQRKTINIVNSQSNGNVFAEEIKGNEFMEEVAVMQRLLHPKVVQLHGISTVADPFYIVTELMPYGDLLTYLRKGMRNALQ